MREKAFEKKVKDFLNENDCWILKTWSNGVQRSGIPDLLVSCNGHFLGVELKNEKGKPSELQLYNIRNIRKSGGFGIVLYPQQFYSFTRLVDLLKRNATVMAKELEKHFDKEEWNEKEVWSKNV